MPSDLNWEFILFYVNLLLESLFKHFLKLILEKYDVNLLMIVIWLKHWV